jgi:hypothetical protein
MARRAKQQSDVVQLVASVPTPAAAVFSFLKEMSAETSWTLRDMEKTLKISADEAKQITTIFEIQVYIRAKDKDAWMTTESGEEVSRAKLPRFTPEHVEWALKSLGERIEAVNRDRNSPFTVIEALAFGDFLRDGSRVQAADVGIALGGRGKADASLRAKRQASEQFLRTLRGRNAALNLKSFEPWMAARSHRKLKSRD